MLPSFLFTAIAAFLNIKYASICYYIYIYINHSAPPGICCYNMPSGVQKDRTKTLKNASLKGEATQKKLTIGNIQRCWRLEEFN